MNIRAFIAGAAGLGLWGMSAAVALAQGPAPTTVQLPTFSFFTVNTTVSVPDGGGAFLGGIHRGFDGSSTRGIGRGPLLANRGLSSGRSTSGMSVHATIIDHHEIDEALLAEAAARRCTPATDPVLAKAERLLHTLGRSGSMTVSAAPEEPLVGSVAEIRRQNELAAQDRAAENEANLAKAQALEKEGKLAVAKIYYGMVSRSASGQLKQQALARLQALSGKGSSVAAK